jgi:nitrogen fixation NifU-like protein
MGQSAMSDINELYQELIIDHGRRPRNFSVSASANCILEGFNPLCGDQLTVYVTEQGGFVKEATFLGHGCAISMASASLMTEIIKDKSVAQVRELFTEFHQLVTQGKSELGMENLGKLCVLAGVAEFPARVKCATLAWHTLIGAINYEQKSISTEDSL